MKPLLKTGFALCLLGVLLACTPPARDVAPAQRPLRALEDIDSMMWQQPDSAFAMLLAFAASPAADSLAGPNVHYFQLLVSELLYKNDYAQSNREDLLRAVDYFDTTDNAFLTARSHYINGVGYYECDSVVKACGEYLRALEVMEDRYEEKELEGPKAKFMALTFTRLTDVFSDQYLHEQTIFFAKRSLNYYEKESQFWQLAYMLDEIGNHYHMMERFDSAYCYYDKALESLSDTNNITYRDIANARLYLMYTNGEKAETIIKQLSALSTQSESDSERLPRYATIGDIYYREGLYDSAWVYLNIVFGSSQNTALRKQSAEQLADICRKQGKEADLVKYSLFLVPFANQEENHSGTKSRLVRLYNNYNQNSMELRHRQAARESTLRYGLVLFLLLVVAVAVLLLYSKSKKRELRLKERISAERNAHQIQQEALSGRLKRSNRELRDLKDRVKRHGEPAVNSRHPDSFPDEPVCRLIMDRVKEGRFKSQTDCSLYKGYALNKEQLSALREAVDWHFRGFCTRLMKDYPELTLTDLDYCCLYLLDLRDADVSALMQRAYPTVSQRSRKIKAVLGKEGALPLILREVANNKTTN